MMRTQAERGTSGRAARLVARVPLATSFGTFDAHAFECDDEFVYVALVQGDLEGATEVLTRVHSECLTGDTLGSLRCDCGTQLRLALHSVAAAGRGVVVYATGHEGRGIGIVDKLRAYAEQDLGVDTLEANIRLGLPVDGRDYTAAALVLQALGVVSVRLMTNNPDKVRGLEDAGIPVTAVQPLATAPHLRNRQYLRTKEERLGHIQPSGPVVTSSANGPAHPIPALDASALIGVVEGRVGRPWVVLKFAQTLDGRIATSTGDAKWISGEDERRLSHALRAGCDAVLVGVGTVIQDDPQLTVRMVAGASPLRVVLDSTLRIPAAAQVLAPDATTVVITTEKADPDRCEVLRRSGVVVDVVPSGPGGVDIDAALAALQARGVQSLLVEGGAEVITSMLDAEVVDRLIVGVAPTVLGSGTEAVGALGVTRVVDGIPLTNRSVHLLSDDVVLAWDVAPRRS